MDKLKVSELKDIIREYKTNNCPTFSKLKKADLINIIKKMNIDDYGVKKPTLKKQSKVKEEKVKEKVKEEPKITITEPKNLTLNLTGKCPSKDIDESTISCDDKKKASKLLHPDRNIGCVDSATKKFQKFNNRCNKDKELPEFETSKESDKDKKSKYYMSAISFIKKYKDIFNKISVAKNDEKKIKNIIKNIPSFKDKVKKDITKYSKLYKALSKNEQKIYENEDSQYEYIIDIFFNYVY